MVNFKDLQINPYEYWNHSINMLLYCIQLSYQWYYVSNYIINLLIYLTWNDNILFCSLLYVQRR